jgi:hypothetical protein
MTPTGSALQALSTNSKVSVCSLNWLQVGYVNKCSQTLFWTVGGPGEHRPRGHVCSSPHHDATSGGTVHQPVRAGCVHGHLVIVAALIALRCRRCCPALAGTAVGGRGPERSRVSEQQVNGVGWGVARARWGTAGAGRGGPSTGRAGTGSASRVGCVRLLRDPCA